jgi:hypothetical protein
LCRQAVGALSFCLGALSFRLDLTFRLVSPLPFRVGPLSFQLRLIFCLTTPLDRF